MAENQEPQLEQIIMSTAAKLGEAQQQKLSEALSVLDKTVLEMIMSHEPLSRVLESLCLKIEDCFQGLVCSILILDSDAITLRHGAGPSLPQAYVAAIDGVPVGPRAGSCGTAAYRAQPVVVTDIATDPLWAEYRQLALAHGLRACWSMPISSRTGIVLGTFACYYREPRTPEADHLLVIDRAVHLAGIAIERSRTKSDLEAAEHRYRTLVERLPAITYMAEVGVTGRWLFVSPQIQSMLGYTPAQWMADPSLWMTSIHEDDLRLALEAEKRVQETGELYKAEYRMRARNGRVLWFRDEGAILDDMPGPKPIMQGVLYDITQYKHLEEQLRQAQKMEAVGQLAGGIAHDFNNLLTVMGAHNDRIRERHAPEHPSYADASEVQEAVARATSLTQQLLAFSRKQFLQPRVLNLGCVLPDLGNMIRRVLTENIALQMKVEPHLYRVKVDRTQIEQAILNLTVNARDAMPKGGEIAISATNLQLDRPTTLTQGSLEPGNYVLLAVQDSGIGMDEETQSHIFEPFFTTKKPGKGTGLGLSTVYGVMKQSGGAISVESAPHRGTLFKLFFPECKESGAADEKSAPVLQPLEGNETVLFVEDQSAIREVGGDYLMKLGYNVLAAPDGETAIKIAATYGKSIDLLVTDVVMPNMGGQELAARLVQTYPKIKVLFMSGYPDGAPGGWENASACADLLSKPFSLKALASRVRTLLDSARANN
ncbi:MAG: PAS domain-containing protein [Acidobacteria bacterium]|nr:PAS domain-containing protein [Acidobacteriota bacterium]